ncbi:MAG: hydrolase [Pirellulaceae bacterium]|nr:hydrolase [Pirellulaceae bacterium]
MKKTTEWQRSLNLLDRQRSALLVVDVQSKLVPHIPCPQRLVWNIRRLIDAAKLFEVPVQATEQYPQGLGSTVSELKVLLPEANIKSMFSCRECEGVFQGFWNSEIRQIVVTGIETHVCVLQTVFDLMEAGFSVFLPVDAVGSRFEIDREVALRRMSDAGATITTVEGAMFEWAETSNDPKFKALSQLVRETGPSA